MSRTYRNPSTRHWGCETRTQQINFEINRWNRHPYKTVKFRKNKEEWEAECLAAKAAFDKEVAELGPTRLVWSCSKKEYFPYPRVWYKPSKYRYKRVPYTLEEAIEDGKRTWEKRHRDGYLTESGRKSGFRHDSALSLRRRNKRFCSGVMHGKDLEDNPYPHRREDKCKIWDWF